MSWGVHHGLMMVAADNNNHGVCEIWTRLHKEGFGVMKVQEYKPQAMLVHGLWNQSPEIGSVWVPDIAHFVLDILLQEPPSFHNSWFEELQHQVAGT